jgi:pimeloyl-ACP methyl ester carboxylesterase
LRASPYLTASARRRRWRLKVTSGSYAERSAGQARGAAVHRGRCAATIAITSWAERYPRRVADRFVELPGGHCTILERPDEVNAHLRRLVDSVGEEQRATS